MIDINDINDVQQILDDDKAPAWELRQLAASLLNDLLETQAREKVMLDALRLSIETSSSWRYSDYLEARTIALEMPQDNTALKAALTAERERCVDKLMKFPSNADLSVQEAIDVIRALGDT